MNQNGCHHGYKLNSDLSLSHVCLLFHTIGLRFVNLIKQTNILKSPQEQTSLLMLTLFSPLFDPRRMASPDELLRPENPLSLSLSLPLSLSLLPDSLPNLSPSFPLHT